MPHPYKPKAAPGTTDDYHCTLFNPHVTKNSYIVSSQFFPGSPEVHHAALYLVAPSLAAVAERDNEVGKGWTCFGEGALPGTSLGDLSQTPLLSFWAPGHGADKLPQGTGVVLPAGSLVIMQVHFNLLVGDQPVEELPGPPHGAHLDAASAPAPGPDAGPTGHPLPDRGDRTAVQPRRLAGQSGPTLRSDGGRGSGRNRGPVRTKPVRPRLKVTRPPVCRRSDKSGYIVRVQAHMHLLGRTFTMVLNPGTPKAQTVLNVPDYDFHDQRSYNLATPIRSRRESR